MASKIWTSDINRRDFLRGSAALGLGGSALWLAMACSGSTGAGSAEPPAPTNYPKAQIDGDLEFFNWSQYLNPDAIKAFQKQYNVKVNQTNFDNMQSMMAKLNAGIPYDITFPTMDYADQLIRANFLLPIDHTQLANWSEVPSYFNNPWYDPHAYYSVPYALWTTGIAWRKDQVPDSFTGSWSDIWNLAPKYNGKLFLLDDFQETLGMSLLRNKKDINSSNRGELDNAVSEILKIKSHVGKFSTDDITNMENGSAWIHHAWSGDIYQVILAANDPSIWQYQTCSEGVPTGNDTFVIPKNAKHPGTALKFIDFMLDPKNAAGNVDYFGYPQVTNSGIQHYNSTIAQTYPFLQMTLEQAIVGLREIAPTGAKLQMWDQEWTKVKVG
jgi:spermidine/putrescine transport system substrate-binding protein